MALRTCPPCCLSIAQAFQHIKGKAPYAKDLCEHMIVTLFLVRDLLSPITA